MNNLAQLKDLLLTENHTCVVAVGSQVFTCGESGIRPLLKLIESGTDFRGGRAADRIVGKAAALLYAHMGINELYAEVLSEQALPVLREYRIATEFGVLTKEINNRNMNGICPMEQTVISIDEPLAAYAALAEKVRSLSKSSVHSVTV